MRVIMNDLWNILHLAALASYILSLAAWFLSRVSSRLPESTAAWIAALGLVFQTAQLLLRWRVGGYLPVTGLFEAQHFLTFWVVALTLYFYIRYGASKLLPASMLLAVLALILAMKGQKAVAPLTPTIDTPLFIIHIATSFAAYGLFSVGAILGSYRLAGIEISFDGSTRRMLDESLYIGYILFTWTMIAGSLWSYLIWGSYWSWRIKGIWSWILWFYYSGVLHVRNRQAWEGWPLDVLMIVGFILVLFTYLGLGLLFSTSHPLL